MRIIKFDSFAFLLFLGLSFCRLTQHPAHAEGIFNFDVKRVAGEKALNFRKNHPVKLLATHLYDLLVRKGIVPAALQDLEEAENEYGSSPYHKIARGWHKVFFRHLRIAEFPESWRNSAAASHKRLGGKGDLLKSLPEPGEKKGHFNIRAGKLRSEFLNLAIFALWANVPESIKTCGPEESVSAILCIEGYEEALRNALRATLLTFYRFVVPRYPSSRLVTASFVLAVASPCPFGYLTEPQIILAALREDDNYLLNSVASASKILKAEPCKEMRTALLKLLAKEGVTPADHISIRKVDEELGKIEESRAKRVEAERDNVEKAGEVDRSTLLKPAKKKEEEKGKDGKGDKKKGEDKEEDTALDLPESLFQALEDYLTDGPFNHHDPFFASSIGHDIKSTFFSDDTEKRIPYQDRVKAFLENQKKNPLKGAGDGALWSELLADFRKHEEEEENENPQKIPLKRGKQTPEKEAKEALYLARNFRGRRKQFEVPQDDEDKKKN